MATWNTYSSHTKKFTRAPTLASWKDLPWVDLAIACKEEMDLAIETAQAELESKYEAFISRKAQEGEHDEGSLREQYSLGSIPNAFDIKRKAADKAVVAFIERHYLKSKALDIMPAIIDYISTFKLTTMAGTDYDKQTAAESIKTSTNEGLLSAAALYRAYFAREDLNKGLYHFLMLDTKSSLLECQYKAPARNYCTFVPLIMYAFKLKHGIPYSHWDRSGIVGITAPSLAKAMLFEIDTPFTVDEILHARNTGLKIKSGDKMGGMRNPVYTYKLYGPEGMAGVPTLVQTMLTQIWCTHPVNRTKYMILNPTDWDDVPAPLVSTEVTLDTVPEYIPTTKADTAYSSISDPNFIKANPWG